MSSYLLDTGVLLRHVRGQKSIVQLVRGLGRQDQLVISVITRLEVRAGMHPSERYATQKLLSRFTTFAVDRDIADRAGDLVREGRSSGRVRSLPDAIIAATALEHHLTLITFNVADFASIPGLSLYTLPAG